MSVFKISDEFERAVNYIGDKVRVAYLKNNKYNDYEDNPAIEIKYSNGDRRVLHYLNNKLHKLDGPAVILYDVTGREVEKKYYIEDQFFESELSYLTAVALYNSGNKVTEDILEDLDPKGESEYAKLKANNEIPDWTENIGTNLDDEEDANNLFNSLGI